MRHFLCNYGKKQKQIKQFEGDVKPSNTCRKLLRNSTHLECTRNVCHTSSLDTSSRYMHLKNTASDNIWQSHDAQNPWFRTAPVLLHWNKVRNGFWIARLRVSSSQNTQAGTLKHLFRHCRRFTWHYNYLMKHSNFKRQQNCKPSQWTNQWRNENLGLSYCNPNHVVELGLLFCRIRGVLLSEDFILKPFFFFSLKTP